MPAKPLEDHLSQFGGLTREAAAEAGARFKTRRHKRRDLLMKPGAVPASLFYVEQGLLRLFLPVEDGQDRTLQFAMEGWWLTDFMAFFGGTVSAFGIDALEDCVLRVLPRAAYEPLFAASAPMEGYFRRLYQRAYAAAQRRAHVHELRTARERYEFFVASYPTFVERIPQYMLASFLGMTPEFLSRLRKRRASGRT
jgi:CRP/FNR family transcriptional regulator, anaerobic regulatory protein